MKKLLLGCAFLLAACYSEAVTVQLYVKNNSSHMIYIRGEQTVDWNNPGNLKEGTYTYINPQETVKFDGLSTQISTRTQPYGIIFFKIGFMVNDNTTGYYRMKIQDPSFGNTKLWLDDNWTLNNQSNDPDDKWYAHYDSNNDFTIVVDNDKLEIKNETGDSYFYSYYSDLNWKTQTKTPLKTPATASSCPDVLAIWEYKSDEEAQLAGRCYNSDFSKLVQTTNLKCPAGSVLSNNDGKLICTTGSSVNSNSATTSTQNLKSNHNNINKPSSPKMAQAGILPW